MSKAKHTPGPWTVYNQRIGVSGTDLGSLFVEIKAKSGETIIKYSQHVGEKSYPELHANARLLATAPEILEALERLIYLAAPIMAPVAGSELTAGEQAIANARRIIAKAKGEE